MTYQAEFENNEMEVFTAVSNEKALTEAFKMEKDHGALFNLFLLDDSFNEIGTLL